MEPRARVTNVSFEVDFDNIKDVPDTAGVGTALDRPMAECFPKGKHPVQAASFP